MPQGMINETMMDEEQRPAPQGGEQQAAPPRGALPPEVREVMVKVILAAMKIIYSETKGLLDVIARAPDPQQGIAMASKIVLDKIEQSAKGVPPEVIQRIKPGMIQKIGPIVGSLLAELAVESGIMEKGALGQEQAPQQEPAEEVEPQQGIVAGEMEA